MAWLGQRSIASVEGAGRIRLLLGYGTIGRRSLHTTSHLRRRNIRKFPIINKIGQYDPLHIPKELHKVEYNYPMEICPAGIRHPGFWFVRRFQYIKEMEPELMVPDLTGFNLKPYVSYKAPDITQSKFTAKELFEHVYGDEVLRKFSNDEEIHAHVTEEEIEEAKCRALQTGADLFPPGDPFNVLK